MAGQAHGFAGLFFGNAVHFKQNRTGFDLSYEKLRVAFAATHFDVLRFAGYWRVRKDSYPDLTAALNIAGHGLTGGFYLTGADAFAFQTDQTKASVSKR